LIRLQGVSRVFAQTPCRERYSHSPMMQRYWWRFSWRSRDRQEAEQRRILQDISDRKWR